MSLERICGLAVALGISGVAHADPLAIRTTGALPFTVAELEAALAVRANLATSASGPQVVAAVSAGDSGIHVAVGDRQREVALDGQGGVDAARLVAFAILDLAGDRLDPPRVEVRAVPISDARTVPRWSFGVWSTTGSQVGAVWDGVAELGLPIADALRATVSAGWGERASLGAASIRAIPLRAGLAWRGLRLFSTTFELRAGAVAVVADASAMRGDTSVIIGGGAAIVWVVPLVRGLALLSSFGADAFATAREYRIDGVAAGATARAATWAGVGLAWEMWR